MEQRKNKGDERLLQIHLIDLTGDHHALDLSGHADVADLRDVLSTK